MFQGWQGTGCDEDIDECVDTSICDDKSNSYCHNTNGSHLCNCDGGFFEDNQGLCQGKPNTFRLLTFILSICKSSMRLLMASTHSLRKTTISFRRSTFSVHKRINSIKNTVFCINIKQLCTCTYHITRHNVCV